jgi:geranylgeranyl transferase type-2 subunit beta
LGRLLPALIAIGLLIDWRQSNRGCQRAVQRGLRHLEFTQQPDGSWIPLWFGNQGTAGQTNATAAAVGFLMIQDAVSLEQAAITARFFSDMQCEDGGLKPHRAIEEGDLLSTFTGLLTLGSLDEFKLVDAGKVAQFLRRSACPEGGFLASPADGAPDVECTYYGLGTLVLLRVLTTSS